MRIPVLLPALGITFICAFACVVVYAFWIPPQGFPAGRIVTIPPDAGVQAIAATLEGEGAISSPTLFSLYTRITGTDRSLTAGPYIFETPLGLAEVVQRIARGDHGLVEKRVTFTEGMTAADMADALAAEMPGFDTEAFLAQAEPLEGQLFPDTYFFLPTVTPAQVVEQLRAHFDERIAELAPEIEASGRSREDIVIMASILEREAQSPEDMRLVAGILWNRIDADMGLQVDAVFGYLHGINGYTPTAADLELDSPYNTYLYRGLPPTAISNPGMNALRAAADPAETDYLYYLTGRDGNMYYGRTFEEHKENRVRYLDI